MHTMYIKERAVFRCGICGESPSVATYEAREMMFGLRDRFHYMECAQCGSLWLTDPPDDFSAYYANDYFSFRRDKGGIKARVIEHLRTKRDRAYFGNKSLVGRFLSCRYDNSGLRAVSKLNAKADMKVLDLGCGSGQLLRSMAVVGFKNLTGADPYLSNDMDIGNGVRIRKCWLHDMVGEKYDLVMLHHTLEHVADPVGTMRTVAGMLASGGKCLVRLPVVAHAWEHYKTNWVQLDPPRHVWLPTEKAMTILAESAGFSMQGVDYDSTDFQFWGSELYSRDVPLRDVPWKHANSRDLTPHFRREEIADFRRKASTLNREKNGDQAAFYFSRN